MATEQYDFIIIGAGMAGASLAAQLAGEGRTLLLEAESLPGYHSTGRSAALFTQLYGNAAVRALTRASRQFLFAPPPGFSPVPLVRQRDTLYFASHEQLDLLAQFRGDADISRGTALLSAQSAQDLLPLFRPGYLGGAALEQDSADVDVDALHQGYLRQARSRGCELRVDAAVEAMSREQSGWVVQTRSGSCRAPIVINAAGAWGDEVAVKAGVAPIGLRPLRRTALLIDPPEGMDAVDWPAAIAVDESFYFRPESGRLMLSPADEEPCAPGDVQPEELDVAIAVDRYEQAVGTSVRRIARSWAGLRVFSPDRTPVVGFDEQVDGFFWLAGQGGYGIQTAPAMGAAAAALLCGKPLPQAIQAEGVDVRALSPARFRTGITRGPQ